ncbi:MAG: glycosyltransferase [Bryobacteraceae bacterium]|nr:glycosyltransferase [Bryobacteraceae bacterium]
MLSIIVPVKDSAAHLRACLKSIEPHLCEGRGGVEAIVVDDGSSDDSARVARQFPVRVIECGTSRGLAQARNVGAKAARGSVFLFVDADVALHADTIERIEEAFRDPAVDAVSGCCDDRPADASFVSQFRNLLHHYMHQTAGAKAGGFWTGCGAIRREAFERLGGFDAGVRCDFGLRLSQSGKLRLDPAIQVQTRKVWTLAGMFQAGMTNPPEPASGVLLIMAFALAVAGLAVPGFWAAALAVITAVVWLHRGFFGFLVLKRSAGFALGAIPLHLLYFLCCTVVVGCTWFRHRVGWLSLE